MAAKGTGVPAQNHRTVATVSSPQRSGELDEILNDLLRETPAEASVRERTLAKSWGTREREFSAPQGCVSTQSGGSQTVLTWQTSRDGPRKCVTVSKETVRRPTPGNTLGNSLQQHGGVTGSRFTDERSLLDVVDGRRFQDPPSYQESRTLQTHTETKTRERVLSPVFRRPVASSDQAPRVPPAPPDRRRVLSPEIMSDGTVLSPTGYSSPVPQGHGQGHGQGQTYTLPQHQPKRSVTSHRNYASDSEEALTWLEEQKRKLEQRRANAAGRNTTMNHRLQYHTTDRSKSSTDFTRTLPGGGSRPSAPVFPPSDTDDFTGPKSRLSLKNSLSADGLNRTGKAASSGFHSAPRTTDVPRFAKDYYGDASRFRSVENRGRDDRFYHVSSIQRPSSATPHTKYSFTMPAGGSRPGLSAPTSPVIPVRGVSSRDAVIRSQGKASEWFGVAESATYDRLDDADDTLRKSSGGVHLTAPLKPVTPETELISLRPIGPGVRDLEPGGTVDGTLNFRRSTPALNRISQDYSHGKSQGELRSQSSLGRSTLMVSPESQRRDLNSYATLPISTVRSSALRDSYVFAPIQRPFTSLGPAPQSNDSGSFQSSQRRLYSTEAVHGSLGGSRQPVYDVQQPGHAWSSTGQQQTMSQQWLKQQQPLPQQQQFSQQEVQYRQQVQQQQKQLLIQEQLRQLDLQHEQQKQLQLQEQQRQLQQQQEQQRQLQLQEQQRQLQLQEQQRQLIQQQEQQRLLQLQEQQRQLQQQQEEQRQLQLQEQQRLLQQQQEQQRLLQLQEQQRQLQLQEEQRQLQLQEQQRQLQQQQEQQRLLQLQEQQRQLQQQQEEQRQLQLQEQQRQLQQQQEQQRLLQLQEQQRQQEEQRQLQIQEQQMQLQIQEQQRQLQQQLEEQRQLQIQEQQRQLQQQLEEQRQLQQRQQEQLVAQQKQLQQQQEEQRQLQLQEQQRQLLQQQEQQRQLIQQQEQQRQLIQQQEQQRQLQQHQQLLHSQTIQRMYVVEEKTQLSQGQGPPLTTQTLDSRVRGASFTSGQPVSEFTSQETFQKTAFVEPPRSTRSDAVVQLESSRRNESVTGSSSNQYTTHQSGSSSQAVQVQGVGLNQTTGQVGANQVGLNQVGVNQVGLNQVGVNQVGLSQTGGQVGLNQVGVNQVGLNQTVGQVGANQTGQVIERRYVVEREVVGKDHTGDQVIINQTGGQVGMNQVGTTQPTGGGQVGRQVIEQRYTVERQVIGKGQGAQQVGTTSLSSGLADANQGQKTHAVEAGQVAYQTAYQGGNQTAYQSGNQLAYQSGTQIGTQQAVHPQGDKYQTGTVEKSTLVQSAGGTQGERYVQQAGTANQQHPELRFGGGGGAVTTGGGNKVLTSPGGSQRIEIISTESGGGQQQHHLQQQSQQQQQQEQHSYAYGFQQVGERSDGAGWTLERGGATNDGRATTSASHQTIGSMNPGGSWTLRPEVSRSGGHQRNASGSFVDGRQASPRFDLGRSRTSSTTCLPDGFAEWSHQPPRFVRDTSQYWHKPNISRDDAISLLLDKEPGSFVVRNSSTFPGSFGLALKVSQVPPNMQTKGGDPQVDLIRHFLIEPTPNGVRLKGCSNEPVFASLSSLIYQHSMTPLSLPCRLKLPDEDTLDSAAASNSQLNGAACTVLYMSSVETENLTGPEALARSIKDLFESGRPLPRSTIVQLKVTRDGITLTDNRRKIFFRRFYPIQTVTFCGVDPRDRRWTVRSEDITISGKAFGFVARKPGVTRENACHVFLELDPTQPATTIVNFVSKVLIGQGQRLIQ